MSNKDDFSKWSELIFDKLDTLQQTTKDHQAAFQAFRDDVIKDIAVLKTKAGVWGGIVGAVGGAVLGAVISLTVSSKQKEIKYIQEPYQEKIQK